MKLKLIVALLALAGLAAALALASPTRAGDGTTTTTTGGPTAAGEQHGNKKDNGKGEHGQSSCQNVELKGAAGSGTVSFTVSRSEHKSSSLVGKQVTLTIPAGSALSVQACRDATGALTLRGLHVGKASPTTTPSTTGATGATGAQP